MVLSLLCGALSAAALVHALVPPGPRATDIVVLPLDAQTPAPTTPPSLHSFLKRQNGQTVLVAPDNTCGYVSGQSDAAYTCVDKSALCVFITVSGGGAAGCCGTSDCGFRIACLDYDQYHSSSLCDAQCSTDTFTEKCTNPSAPYCGTILFPNSATDYFCNSLRPTGAYTADTTYAGQRGRSLIQTVLADETSVSRRPLVTVTATASASSTPPSSPGSSTPVGAIVGGVVGGVAVLGLLGLGAFFLLKQRKKTKFTPVPGNVPGQESGQGQGAYPSSLPGPSPSPGLGSEGADVGIKPGHQSMMSAYSAAPPYGTPTPPLGAGAGGYQAYVPPPPQQQQPGQGGYYPAGAGGYGQQSPPYQQGGNMNMNMPVVYEAGGEMVQVGRPVEMEAPEVRRHELQ